MIYVTTIALIAICHLIHRRGRNGCRVSMRLEKSAVFITAIASMAAIIELGRFVVSFFDRDDSWFPEILVYPAGVILFVFVVFVLLPGPIPRAKQAETDAGIRSKPGV